MISIVLPINGPVGVTWERKQHSDIAVEVRTITKGGMIASYGNRDLDHCLLDTFYRRGLLGNQQDASDRYSTGYRLRELYYSFNSTGTPLEERGKDKSQYTAEGDIGHGNDARETLYHLVMRLTHPSQRYKARDFCVEDKFLPIAQAIDCLDALRRAFYQVDNNRQKA